MPYLPIQDHGLIGNLHTAALVGLDGTIDWLCLPHFDAPSVFAALLDDEHGGRFQIRPVHNHTAARQLYWPDTNVLVTRFMSEAGVAEVIDYMPAGLAPDAPGFGQLIRRVEVVRGRMPMEMTCTPAFDYARAPHTTELTRHGAVFRSDALVLGLAASVPLDRTRHGVRARFTLRQGECARFALQPLRAAEGPRLDADQERTLFDHTVRFWQSWLARCTYDGRWREHVHRSALTLKLLTFEPTGAIVAAPTCSLPEHIGGARNWDYRYTWIRDAAFTVYALLRIGLTDEATAFIDFLQARCRDRHDDGSLQIVYGIHGDRDLAETTLDHLAGYRGSTPVRIGNGAFDQLQLDIYGELMDAVYLYNKYCQPIGYDFWTQLHELVDWVCDHWEEPDAGIWEVRGPRRHFVYSKLMCWVAVDRGLRLARKRSFPADRERWLRVRDAIYRRVMTEGWSAERRAFKMAFDLDALDAATLIMPLVFFTSPTDPRMLHTLEALRAPLEEGGLLSDHLVHRYNPAAVDDGLGGQEGTFNMCTFWLVEALTRAGRTHPAFLHEARLMFEKMLGYANHLGLFAEETGPCGEALGNFPQAFTHLSLISAAYNLDRALDGKPFGKVG